MYPSYHHSVKVLRLSKRPDTDESEFQKSRLEIDRWNNAYRFVTTIDPEIEADNPKLKDPSYLIISIPLSDIIKYRRKLLVSELRILASAHSVRYFNRRRVELLDALSDHQCTAECNTVSYIFKELPRLKFARPWDVAASMQTSQATSTESRVVKSSAEYTMATNPTTPGLDDTSQESRSCSDQMQEDTDIKSGDTNYCPSVLRREEGPEASGEKEYATEDRTAVAVEKQNSAGSSQSPPAHLNHLKPATEKEVLATIKKWQKTMNISNFIKGVCSVCSEMREKKYLKRKHANEVKLELLRNEDVPKELLPTAYDVESYRGAILEPKGLEDLQQSGYMKICTKCLRDLNKGKMPRLALANWLYYAHDKLPPDVSKAFADLTAFEKALICRVRTNSVMCRFYDPHIEEDEPYRKGSRHIRGNVVSTPLNVPRLNSVLPPSPSAIKDTVCALFVSKSPPTKDTINRMKPVLVRKSRVKTLIEFLINHNPHYHSSTGFRGYSSDNLEALFEEDNDEGIPSAVQIGFLPINQAIDAIAAEYDGRSRGLSGLFMENTAFTTGDASARSYREMCMDALTWCKQGKPFLSTRAGSTPIPDIANPNWLSWAHPNVDPFGIGGFNDPRRKRAISPEVQLRHLLNVYNPTFETDHELAFDVYNILRKAMVNTSLRFVVPVSRYHKLIEEIKGLDCSRIDDLILKYKLNPSYIPQSDEEKRIAQLTMAISPIARGIPGGAAQRIKMRNEIRGIINQRGSPTLFITLNPADHHNPLVAVLATRDSSAEEIQSILNMNVKQRMQTSLRHPVACARFFDLMIKSFVSIILKADKKGVKRGIFGQCESYYGTVETQGRGSLHCHMLIWLQGHLPPEELAETLRTSSEYREALVSWLDSIMDSGFNGMRAYLNGVDAQEDDELIKEDAVHPGMSISPDIKSFRRRKVRTEITEMTDDLLLRYNWHKHTGTCWKYLRPGDPKTPSNCRFGIDGGTRPNTTINAESGEVEVRRRHARMTSYNPTTTFLMKCNTDFKFIGTGEDAKAFLYYVTDYITKAPLSMYAGLAALAYAIRMYSHRGIDHTAELDEEQARQAMTIAVNSMLGHQEFSHPQVMAFLLGQGESYSCETFQSVNWSEILTFVNSKFTNEGGEGNRTVESMEVDQDTPNAMGRLNLSVAPHEKGVSASNQLLDYIYRPSSEPFASMGLYKHLSWTIRVSKTDKINAKNKGRSFSSPSHPQYATHNLKSRSNPAVPVLLGPSLKRKYGTETEQEEWAREMVVLFKPWRNPSELKENGESWKEALERLQGQLDSWDDRVMKNLAILPEAKCARDQRPRHRGSDKFKRPLYTIDLESGQEMPSEGPVAEGNVYELVAEDENITETDAHLTMEKLVNEDTTRMFKTCYREDVSPQVSKGGNESKDPEGKEMTAQDGDLIQQQKKYMATNKHRRIEKKDKQTPKQQLGPDMPPDVKIDTVHEIANELKKEGQFTPWKVVKKLIEKRGLGKNPEQLRAFGIIANHVIEGGDQLLMYVGGEGGTGKSYLINTVVMLFKLLAIEESLRLGALTGIAASLIGGQTLHSLLAINPSRKKGGVTKRLVKEWRNVRYLIVDEVSMIGAPFMAKISTRIRHAKGDNKLEARKPFGGVNIIFMGDFLQLTPPRQPSLFSHRIVQNQTFVEAKNTEGLNSLSGVFLWRQVDKVVILRRNKRHQNDANLAKLLTKMRSDPDDVNDTEPSPTRESPVLDQLYERVLSSVFKHNPDELILFRDAPVIVGNKTIRDALNVKLITAHASRLNRRIYTYYSTDIVEKEEVRGELARMLRGLPSRVTRDHLGKIPVFIGMKVMITENISVPFKVVNGSEGTVRGIRFKTDSEGRRRAEVAYVAIEKCSISAPDLPKGVVPVFAKAVNIAFSLKGQGIAATSFKRVQIPLVPSYAITDYKSQGRTLDRAIIDLATARGQGSYVMLSRTQTLKGILILRWFQTTKVTQRKPQELRNELSRLSELDKSTIEFYETNINEKIPVKPMPTIEKKSTEEPCEME